MDPNATLKHIEDMLNLPEKEIRDRKPELQHHIGAIQQWLGNGGFQPDWNKYPKATRLFKNGVIYG